MLPHPSSFSQFGQILYPFFQYADNLVEDLVGFSAQRLSLFQGFPRDFYLFVAVPFIIQFFWYFFISACYFLADLYLYLTRKSYRHRLQNLAPVSWNHYLLALLLALFNQFFVTIPILLTVYPIQQWLGISPEFSDALEHLPFLIANESLSLSFSKLGTFVFEVVVVLFFEEVGFYYSHRLCHESKYLFNHVHSIHHQFVAPMAVSAIAAHPFEHFLANISPLIIGPLIVRWPFYITLTWILFALFHTLGSHSGFIWSFAAAEGHDLHHEFLQCNYGVLFFCDYFHKTRIEDNPRFNQYWKTTKKQRQQWRIGDKPPYTT